MNKRVISLLFAGLAIVVTAKAQEPTTWRGPGSTGNYSETGLLKSWPANGPEMVWHFDELGDGFSSPVFANGKIYVSGAVDNKGYIYAINSDVVLIIRGRTQWLQHRPSCLYTELRECHVGQW